MPVVKVWVEYTPVVRIGLTNWPKFRPSPFSGPPAPSGSSIPPLDAFALVLSGGFSTFALHFPEFGKYVLPELRLNILVAER